MRLFIGYGYNNLDKWIEEYVFPLVAAFGWEAVHGRAVYGGTLPDEVIRTIRISDAMIGFRTRRDAQGTNEFTSHTWVEHELLTAHAQDPRIPWVEVRQEGVIEPGGILTAADAQRIDYRESDRALCLVKIAETLKRFRELTRVTQVRLGPAAAVEQISSLLDHPTFACTCQVLRGAAQSAPQKAAVVPIKGGLFAQLRGAPEGELIRITISAGGHVWRSSYESVDTVDIQVKE
jgi:hypothetical protein